MAEDTRVSGKITNCTGKGAIPGLMEDAMKACIVMIRRKALVFTYGQTVEDMRANGSMANNTVKVALSTRKARVNEEYGPMAIE